MKLFLFGRALSKVVVENRREGRSVSKMPVLAAIFEVSEATIQHLWKTWERILSECSTTSHVAKNNAIW